MNAKLPSFSVHLHPDFTVANAPVQQSSAPEDASRIYAEIKRLKHLAETIGWNDANKVEARQLYEQWWNLDEGDDSPLNPLGMDWLKLKPFRLKAMVDTPMDVNQMPTTGQARRKK